MVYIDNARIRFGRMLMNHMLADTAEELHAMADTIGIKRIHYQRDASTPHYDVCVSKRELAIEAGAKPLNSKKQVVAVLQRLRAQREAQETKS